MKSKRIRRMIGIRKGGVAVITVQYEDGEVMQYISERGESHEDLHCTPVHG